jgi:oligosaccharyltransferase complex subunit beta
VRTPYHPLEYPDWRRLGYGPSLTPKILLDYTNTGGNVLLGLSSEAGTPSAISSLLLEFDISLSPEKNSLVVDHFNYDTVSSPEKHDVLLVNRPGALRSDVTNYFGGEGVLALPKPVGQTLGNASPLISPILKAPVTAYTYNPKDEGESVEEPFATGSQIALVSAMQARNSARFTVLGSLEMLQDKWFDASGKTPSGTSTKTVNREFARQLTEWTFKEVGVLKVFGTQHHEVKGGMINTTDVGLREQDPEIYRIKNDVVCPDHHPAVPSLILMFRSTTPSM